MGEGVVSQQLFSHQPTFPASQLYPRGVHQDDVLPLAQIPVLAGLLSSPCTNWLACFALSVTEISASPGVHSFTCRVTTSLAGLGPGKTGPLDWTRDSRRVVSGCIPRQTDTYHTYCTSRPSLSFATAQPSDQSPCGAGHRHPPPLAAAIR